MVSVLKEDTGRIVDNGPGVYGKTYYQNEQREADGQDQADKNGFSLKFGVNCTF